MDDKVVVSDVSPMTQLIAVGIDASTATLEKIAEGNLTSLECKELAEETLSQMEQVFKEGISILEESGVPTDVLKEILGEANDVSKQTEGVGTETDDSTE